MKNFKIPAVPRSVTKSIRFPVDLAEKVERELWGSESTFTAFVVGAVRYVLEKQEDDKIREDIQKG